MKPNEPTDQESITEAVQWLRGTSGAFRRVDAHRWADALERLAAENARLSGELAAAKLDTARLDHLDSVTWHGGTVGPYMGGETVSIQFENRPRETTRGIRAAIDAALAKTP